jgi:hypothetical protein
MTVISCEAYYQVNQKNHLKIIVQTSKGTPWRRRRLNFDLFDFNDDLDCYIKLMSRG